MDSGNAEKRGFGCSGTPYPYCALRCGRGSGVWAFWAETPLLYYSGSKARGRGGETHDIVTTHHSFPEDSYKVKSRVEIQKPSRDSVPWYMTSCTGVDTQPCSPTSISWFHLICAKPASTHQPNKTGDHCKHRGMNPVCSTYVGVRFGSYARFAVWEGQKRSTNVESLI